MSNGFYYENEYRKRQSELTKESWRKGKHDFLIKLLEERICKNPNCKNKFSVKTYSPKLYCSRSCSAHISNQGRKLSEFTKLKISKAILSLPNSFFQKPSLPKISLFCKACGNEFKVVPYLAKKQKYCSVYCSISTTGKLTTSPKASKGKPGIRTDIDPDICFYSTWEANVARVFKLVDLNWVYAPKIFDLGEHTYRPDFYLRDFDMFIEVKNFMGEYSLKRHNLFKEKYPNIKLELIMKEEYFQIKNNYKYFIKNWEY